MSRLVSRVIATILGFALAMPIVAPDVAQAAEPDLGTEATQAKQLNADAQALFAEGRFEEAARMYARIFEVLPENRVNREERDNTLLIVLEVYREAYRQRRTDGSKEAITAAGKLLCDGENIYKKYETRYRDFYGGGADPSRPAQDSYAELKTLMKRAEEDLGFPPCGAPPEEPKVEPPKPPLLPPPGAEPPRGPSGVGLIVAGAVTMAVGVGATSMIIIGGVRRRRVRADGEEDMDEDGEPDGADRDELRKANTLIIAGSITTAVLLAGGATMLGIGIKRRLRYLAVSPQLDRGYVGVGLSGRF